MLINDSSFSIKCLQKLYKSISVIDVVKYKQIIP